MYLITRACHSWIANTFSNRSMKLFNRCRLWVHRRTRNPNQAMKQNPSNANECQGCSREERERTYGKGSCWLLVQFCSGHFHDMRGFVLYVHVVSIASDRWFSRAHGAANSKRRQANRRWGHARGPQWIPFVFPTHETHMSPKSSTCLWITPSTNSYCASSLHSDWAQPSIISIFVSETWHRRAGNYDKHEKTCKQEDMNNVRFQFIADMRSM